MAKHPKQPKAPHLVIEQDDITVDVESDANQEGHDHKSDKKAAHASQKPEVKDYIKRARRSILAAVEELFPGHAHAAICGFAGFIAAILICIIGLWKTLLICFLIAVGVAFGQIYDGNPKIINAVKKFIFESRRS